MVKDAEIVGEALARVLPSYGKSWYRVPHLLKLNLVLLVPLLSSAVAGYDGEQARSTARKQPNITRLDDERSPSNKLMESLLQQPSWPEAWCSERCAEHWLRRLSSLRWLPLRSSWSKMDTLLWLRTSHH